MRKEADAKPFPFCSAHLRQKKEAVGMQLHPTEEEEEEEEEAPTTNDISGLTEWCHWKTKHQR